MKKQILILLIFFYHAQINAQTQFWEESNGPYGGFVTSVVSDSLGKIYLGTEGSGVFYSTNEGMNWNPCNMGLANWYVKSLKITDDGYIFAGTEEGIFKSSIAQINWSQSDSGVTKKYILSMIITHNDIILAGTFIGGIFRSTDLGKSWKPANTGLYIYRINSFAENQQGHIYVGTQTDDHQTTGGVYRSTDEGQTWVLISTPMSVSSLEVDTFNNIYAGTYGGRICKSTDNGNSWFIPDSSLPLGEITSIVNDKNGNLLAAIWGYGLFYSTNQGTDWTLHSEGLTSKYVNCIYIDNLDRSFIGSNGDGFYYSTNSGKIWTQLNAGILNTTVYSISVNNDDYIFVGTGHLASDFSEGSGIFRSTDNGESWNSLKDGLESTWIQTIIYDSDNNYFIGASDGIYKSTDFGNTWSQSLISSIGINALAISGKENIYAGSYHGISFTSDKGETWSQFDSGLVDGSVNCMVASLTGKYIFAGTGNRFGIAQGKVFRTTDSNYTWIETSYGLPNTYIFSLAIDSYDNIYAGTYNRGLFISTNYGNSWQGMGPEGFTVLSIAINSNDEAYICGYSTYGHNVYHTTNDGEDWTAVVKGLTTNNVISLALDSSGYIYAGTFNQGLFKSVSSTTYVIKLNDINVTQFYLSQNYPNPFNPTTKIEFQISNAGPVSLRIYDILGREVATLINEEKPAGNYEVEFDGGNLSSGVYFYKLQAGDFIQTKKMILLR